MQLEASSNGAQVLLVRHAESARNLLPQVINGRSNETPLTVHGLAQASWLGQVLRGQGKIPDVVYSSPAVRTLMTAEHCLIAMHITTQLVVDDRLQEIDMGDWTGHNRKTIYDADMLAQIEAQGLDFSSPGGESMRQVGNRMFSWLNDIDTTESKLHVAFTHGLAIRCLAGKLLDWTRQQIYETETANTSVTGLSNGNEWQVNFINFDPANT